MKSKAVDAGATILPYRVVVLSGLLEALTPSEIEAVFEYECSHLKHMHHLKIMAAHALPTAALMLTLPPQLVPLALTPFIILITQLIVKRSHKPTPSNEGTYSKPKALRRANEGLERARPDRGLMRAPMNP
ncbi:MAG: M48 family metalloprotease [Candidatus Nezhaarchaeales archaeon]